METARRATSDDVARVLSLSAELRAELAVLRGGDLWWRAHDPVQHSHADLVALLGYSDECVLVGCIDDAVVGYAMVRSRLLPDGAHLGTVTEIFVEAGAREVGVGEALLRAAVEWAGERGCIGIDATALPGHRAAKNFFEAQGFVARSLTMHRPLS